MHWFSSRSVPDPGGIPRQGIASRWLGWTLSFALLWAGTAASCKRDTSEPPRSPAAPSLRIYVASTIAGALEPCGCRKDMLGGVDHAAALIEKGKTEAPTSILLAAGPTLFLNPDLTEERKTQDLWKAEGIAEALSDMGLVAWTPGANDFAAGPAKLDELARKTNARVLAANLKAEGLGVASTHVFTVNEHRVGVVGVSHPKSPLGLPSNVSVEDLEPALIRGLQQLKQDKAGILIALVSAERGAALRLAERVRGFQMMIVGKASDRGEGNDPPTPPVLVDDTLVVEAPNHLQALGVVDLYVRNDSLVFRDAAGIGAAEEKKSLERRVEELTRRIEAWEAKGTNPDDVAARQLDLEKMKQRLAQIEKSEAPKHGSFFRYDLREVREGLGSDERVLSRMSGYYRRVNDHNRELFKDRKPKPAAKGEAKYVGTQNCAECHEDAVTFWKDTGHAKAYKTLADDFKEFNLDCVSCHVTGYERPGGSTVTFVEGLKDVQCEECHGPGSIHAETEDSDFIVLRPEKDLCQRCHHPPHVTDDWSAEQAWPRIVGKGHGEDSKP